MQSVIEAAFPWLSVLIAIAFVGGIALWVVRPLRAVARPFGLAVSLVLLGVFVAVLATSYDVHAAGSVQLVESYEWIPSIGATVTWGVTGMGVVMIALALFLVPIVILAAWPELDDDDNRAGGYIGWVLILESIMIGLFAAQDVLLFYILFEAMLIPVYFLVGRYGGARAHRAAIKFLLYSLAGGLIMLVGVIAVRVYGSGGPHAFTLKNLTQTVNLTGTPEILVFLSFFIAFAIKAPMWPVHTWLPDTTEEAPAGTSTLLVGVLDKVGTYGMIAFCLPLFPGAISSVRTVVMVLAIVSIIWGAFMAISSNHLMRLIAYTSVSHFGFIVLGIFSGSSVAMTGAIVYMVAHGVGTAALFLIVGFLERRGKSYRISDYGGWQRVTPLIAFGFMVAGLATVALPGLSGFVPEYMVLIGTFSMSKVAAIFAVSGVILAALYILWPYQRIFTGPRPEVDAEDMNGREKTVTGVLIVAMLVLGFAPAPVIDLAKPVAEQTVAIVHDGNVSHTPASEGSSK